MNDNTRDSPAFIRFQTFTLNVELKPTLHTTLTSPATRGLLLVTPNKRAYL